MLALRSMTAAITTTPDPAAGKPGTAQTVTVHYQAPDRYEAISGTSKGMRPTEVVADGVAYASLPSDPDHFQAFPGRLAVQSVEGFLLPLRDLAQASSVRHTGNHYQVSFPPRPPTSASTIDATVANGRVPSFAVDYSLQGKRYEIRFVFSALNSSPPVAAPPARLIVATPPTSQPPPPCRPGQSSSASCTPQFHPATLPAVGPVHSTMQFRPVLNDQAVGCGSASGQNPDPSATVSLPGPQPGTCLGVGPSTLTISHAQTTATQDQSGQVQVDFTLDPGDAAGFDHLAQANYQRQVAVVMFGQILEAPTINAQSFGGHGQITGLTVDQAARAKAALAGK
jgi:hypothetical protein